MMKKIFPATCLLCAVTLITACGGTKNQVATTPATEMEFSAQTGAWKPLTKVVTPPHSKPGAIIVEQKKPGMMQKIGNTMKKPLKWVGLGKDEPQPEAKP